MRNRQSFLPPSSIAPHSMVHGSSNLHQAFMPQRSTKNFDFSHGQSRFGVPAQSPFNVGSFPSTPFNVHGLPPPIFAPHSIAHGSFNLHHMPQRSTRNFDFSHGQSRIGAPIQTPFNFGASPSTPSNMHGLQPGYGGAQPAYKQITVGQGIDMNEYNRIVDCCKNAFMQLRGAPQTAKMAAEGIKQMLGGDWLVFISVVGYENFDFSMTKVKGGDFMAFSLDNKKFQVCRIK
jgi:hypothetical protein